jgi:hypothetical protein
MLPTLPSGTVVTATRRWRRLRVGDVVALRDPREPGRWLIKRVADVRGRHVELRGDNATASSDSRQFGTVDRRAIRWIVWRGVSGAQGNPTIVT